MIPKTIILILIATPVLSDNSVTFRLLDSVRNKESIVFAPTSLEESLSLLYYGSSDKTADEFKAYLFPNKNMEQLRSEAKSRHDIRHLSSDATLWFDSEIHVNDKFKNVASNYWGCYIGSAPLLKNPDQSVEIIQRWFTPHLSQDFNGFYIDPMGDDFEIQRDDIPQNCALTIVTRIRMSAQWWPDTFDIENTKECPFYTSDESSFLVSMMMGTNKMEYCEDEFLQSTVVPFIGNELNFMLLLPKSKSNLDELCKSLTPERFFKIHKALNPTLVALCLPKVNYDKEIEWRDSLIALGLESACSATRASFSGISNDPLIFLDSLKQKIAIEWDEECMKASATTFSSISVFGHDDSPSPEPVSFNANHPFLFIVYHPDTLDIHFMGAIDSKSQMPIEK